MKKIQISILIIIMLIIPTITFASEIKNDNQVEENTEQEIITTGKKQNNKTKISPKPTKIKSVTTTTDKITIIWKKQTNQTDGYEISYWVSGNSNDKKTIKIKDNQITSKVIKKLEANTKYSIKIRTYKKVNKKVKHSSWSEIFKVRTQQKPIIYLTFDDGPSSNITPRVLDILKNNNVKATFFVINYSEANEKIIKRAYREGHTIAIHGYSHEYSRIYRSESTYLNNLVKLQKKIKRTTGYTPTITRFPGGSSNTVSRHYNRGIMTRLTKLVLKSGFTYFDWNVSSGDAGGAKNGTQMYNNVRRQLSKSRSNVVLMHDFSSNSKVLTALPKIIKYGKEHGYTFERITEKTPMVTHQVNN